MRGSVFMQQERWEEVYKVLLKADMEDFYRGPIVKQGIIATKYKIGHIMRPKENLRKRGYLLTAFKTFNDALVFAQNLTVSTYPDFWRIPKGGIAPGFLSEDDFDIQIWLCFAHGLTTNLPYQLSEQQIELLALHPKGDIFFDKETGGIILTDGTIVQTACKLYDLTNASEKIISILQNNWPQGTIMVKELKMIQKQYSIQEEKIPIKVNHEQLFYYDSTSN